MTLFLRTIDNQTIVDVEIWIKDIEGNSCVELSSHVDIEEYSKLLLKNQENSNAMTNLSYDEFWDDIDI